jgi:iron complex transport system permease protein
MRHDLTLKSYLRTFSGYALPALIVLIAAPLIGSESISISRIYNDLMCPAGRHIDSDIFFHHRLPRVILGFLAGATLATVGAVFQVVLRNPLATPHTLGLTGGAAMGAFIAISLPGLALNWGPFSTVQLFSLAGAAVPMVVIYYLARRPQGISTITLLLAGVIIGIFCSSVNMLIRYLAHPNLLVSMERWLMGGLDVIGYLPIAVILPLLLPGLGLLILQAPTLNHLALGEEIAMGHGIDVNRVLKLAFFAGGVVTAVVVSVVGPIGFVGLIVPHAVRKISGYDHRIVLPASFLTGGTVLVACDVIARTVIAPTEMPVGIITALVGGPFFLYLLIRNKNY